MNDDPDGLPYSDWQPLQIPIDDFATETRALRERCPVPFTNIPGLFAFRSVLGYEEVTRAARDTATFANSSARLVHRRIPLESDPPEHTKIRRLLQPFFMPSALAKFEPISRQYASALIEPFVAAGGGDAMTSLGRPLPVQVLLRFIGQPFEDWDRVKTWSEQVYLQVSQDEKDQQRFRNADAALWEYGRQAVHGRIATMRNPQEDLISAMLSGRIDDQAIEPELAVGTVRLLLAAGHDSTTTSLGICLHYLSRNPQAQSCLRENPALIAAAIEEMLRFESPVLMMPRTVSRDTEFHGQQLKAGERVMLNWASANRDERTIAEPDLCIFERNPNRHLVFGHGIHSCIGAPLARLEIRVALEELLKRSSAFELAGPVQHQIWHRYGLSHLPIQVTRE